ncbi:unnamed protein product [Prunus armeniaca]|uniref:Uncharacterized protein n=1 Tax=Prunus armeniaca TaxID=36596 RepID=A0A6J5U2N3_PRUAR|nr:unnamed protein product [Prunus armeniaca]
MDVMREELPNTMVVVRLSGMEISDLTMELRDLGLPLPFHSCYCLICKCMVALANDSGKVQYQLEKRKKEREVVVRSNQGFGFNGGGGGGGKDDGATARILGNLALAIGLTYLSFTGQLGWILDAIVSIWLLAVLVPIVGVGAFLWWARQDMVQDSVLYDLFYTPFEGLL